MNIAEKIQERVERRLHHERRLFTYTFHIPERRSGENRRYSLRITHDKSLPQSEIIASPVSYIYE